MKVVILAGGYGSRLSEETDTKPKPMVEIGDKPILWHIMKIYSHYGLNDFIICCGYKGHIIKEYFQNFFLHNSDITFSLKNNDFRVHNSKIDPWNVTLVDTGEKTNTGGRLKRIKNYLKNDEDFCFTYGDGVGDINLKQLIKFHKKNKKLATVTATHPQARYGNIKFRKNNNLVDHFEEKPKGDENMINGGFFVLKTNVLTKIKNDNTSWEYETLVSLAKEGQLGAYKHNGFWMPMDTLRDKNTLNKLWNDDAAKWKIWK